MSEFDDKPIALPEEDIFEFKALAQTIADSILKMTAPEGTVIAINGQWGSGKSSLINLVRHHLDNSSKTDDLKIVDFKCWWFRGEEALTIAFFRELYSAMKPTLTWKTKIPLKIALSKLGRYLSLVNVGIAGKIISTIGKILVQANTVESLHKKLSCALADMDSKYLIIIDDIDRLSPDEAILIFRLVKSIGGLPNVMYLLAYDRQLAEKIVTDRYPSEGPHYLEKIVQLSLDVPNPRQITLLERYFVELNKIFGRERPLEDEQRFKTLFDEIIEPKIKTPRDLLRLSNPLKVTWSAVKGDVNVTDFLCIETLRVQHPGLYHALRSNKDYLTKITPSTSMTVRDGKREHPLAQTCEDIFLKPEPEDERERLRRGLMLLFPALAHIWEFDKYEYNVPAIGDDQRHVCLPKYFDTYFRFARPEN